MKPTPIRTLEEVPAVCLEQDLVRIFRVAPRVLRFWRSYPEFLPVPPLPYVDRQTRISGRVVSWFLSIDPSDYQRFRSPLENMAKVTRRNRPPWWRFAPPHDEAFWATPVEGEEATIGLDQAAAILRVTRSALRKAARGPAFPMPAAKLRPMRWTQGQIERLLWSPADHEAHMPRPRGRSQGRR